MACCMQENKEHWALQKQYAMTRGAGKEVRINSRNREDK